MHVVSAGVHDRHILTFVILRSDLAGVRQARFFLYGERVQVRAHKNSRPIAIFHDADHSVGFQLRIVVSAKVLGDLALGCAQFFCDQRCRALFTPGQLRVAVNVFVDPNQRRKLSISKRLRRVLRQNERRNPHRQR
jgi:hypothetical protein